MSTRIVGAGLAPALEVAISESEELCQLNFEHLLSIKPTRVLALASKN